MLTVVDTGARRFGYCLTGNFSRFILSIFLRVFPLVEMRVPHREVTIRYREESK